MNGHGQYKTSKALHGGGGVSAPKRSDEAHQDGGRARLLGRVTAPPWLSCVTLVLRKVPAFDEGTYVINSSYSWGLGVTGVGFSVLRDEKDRQGL